MGPTGARGDRTEWRFTAARSMRPGKIANELFDAAMVGLLVASNVVLMVGLLWWSLTSDEASSGATVTALAWLLADMGLATMVVLMGRPAWRQMRRPTDVIGADRDGLRWSRRRFAGPHRGRQRLAWSQIATVRLGDGGESAVVCTTDRREHVLTDLGSPPQRQALVAALTADPVRLDAPVLPSETLRAELAAAAPTGTAEALLDLPAVPPRWRAQADGARDTVLLWRRAGRWRIWMLGVLTYLAAAAAAGQATGPAGNPLRPWLTFALLAVVAVLVVRIGSEIRRTTTGWLLETGRLSPVRVRARSGRRLDAEERRATSLVSTTHPGNGRIRYHLYAVLDDGRSRPLHRARRAEQVDRFGIWLAHHADLRLDHDVETP